MNAFSLLKIETFTTFLVTPYIRYSTDTHMHIKVQVLSIKKILRTYDISQLELDISAPQAER